MKKYIICFVFLIASFNLFAASDTTITELRGLDDSNGNTHLFYRIYDYSGNNYQGSLDNSIYHYDVFNNSDTLFLRSLETWSPLYFYSQIVYEYKFRHNNPNDYLVQSAGCGDDCIYYLESYNGHIQHGIYMGFQELDNFAGSNSNDSIIYASLSNRIFKTTNFGGSWSMPDSTDDLRLLSINPNNDEEVFALNQSGFIEKSSDGGKTYTLADTSVSSTYFPKPELMYDKDSVHIYSVSVLADSKKFGAYLLVSSHKGDSASWSKKYYSGTCMFIALDNSKSGNIYQADGNNIYFSDDYGNTFSLYKSLDSLIVGIYKKADSDIIYAATKQDIYEITSASIKAIKHLSTHNNILSYYPLHVGDVWVYNGTSQCVTQGITDEMVHVRKVIDYVKKDNNKSYFEIEELNYLNNTPKYYFERIDTNTCNVYRYADNPASSLVEYLIDSLAAVKGDTVYNTRFASSVPPFVFIYEADTLLLNYNTHIKTINSDNLESWRYNLASGLGLVYVNSYDDSRCFSYELKGAVINGTVYGDTSITGVRETNKKNFNFVLNQNYPNPFNPSTVISWQQPRGNYVTLKVYDVLGNEAATIVSEYLEAGEHSITFNTQNAKLRLSSGVYFYRIQAGSFVATKKLVILK